MADYDLNHIIDLHERLYAEALCQEEELLNLL